MLRHDPSGPSEPDTGGSGFAAVGGAAIGGLLGATILGGLFATFAGALFGALVGDVVSSTEDGKPLSTGTKGTATPKSLFTLMKGSEGEPLPIDEEETVSDEEETVTETEEAEVMPSAGRINVEADPAMMRAPVLDSPARASIVAPGASGLRFIPGFSDLARPGLPEAPLEATPVPVPASESPEEREKRLAEERAIEAAFNALLRGDKSASPPPPPPPPPPDKTPDKSTPWTPNGSTKGPEQHNVDGINALRKKHGLPLLARDSRLDAFALAGSKELLDKQLPHTHFNREASGALGNESRGFGTTAGENQGDRHGMPLYKSDPEENVIAQIDTALELMYAEGPGGGHYETMLSPTYRRVGIGLVTDSVGRLFMTNDFSN